MQKKDAQISRKRIRKAYTKHNKKCEGNSTTFE